MTEEGPLPEELPAINGVMASRDSFIGDSEP